MNKGKILLISLAGLLAVSCVNDSVDQPAVAPEVAVAKKFVNTSSEAVSGKLLFYVDEANVAQLESATSVTATGIEAIDAVAKQIGATGFHQVFNMNVNAELKRELGMDRWFAIEFPEDVNVDEAAKALAAAAEGNYAQAQSQLEGYNAAVAATMNADYTAAKQFIANDATAKADYLRAVIATKQGDMATATAELKSAIAKDASYAERCKKDVNLRKYIGNEIQL